MLAALLLNLTAGPAPAPVEARRLGAPVWLKPIWTEEDAEELAELKEEVRYLEEIVAKPIVYAPKKEPATEEKEDRLRDAIERLSRISVKVERLERALQEAIEYAEFVMMMGFEES